MKRRMFTGIAVLAVIAAAVFAVRSALVARECERAARARIASLGTVAAQAAEIESLRATVASRRTGVRPDAGMVGQLSTALGKAGIPTTRLAEVAPEPETGLVSSAAGTNAADLRRQAVRLTLQPVSLPEIGRFLHIWRAERPEWTISGIEVTRAGPPEVGIEPKLRCLITLSAVYPANDESNAGRSAGGSS